MANVPKSVRSEKDNELKKLSNDINDKMRSFWVASKGHRLVGVDADGIQMRVFAHYVDDQRLTDALLKGSKSDGTDIHSLHKRALGEPCRSRDAAKTFIYAWLLGASTGKVAEILECSHTDAAKASADFLGFYPGLKDLKKSRIPADAARGYFIGLDGRPVCCSSRHHMLAGYLQNGEAVIQKLAAHEWTQRLWSEGVPFRFVNFVHDEFQIEVPEEFAEYVASVVCQSIVDAGLYLDLKIPLAGSAHIGSNWLETH